MGLHGTPLWKPAKACCYWFCFDNNDVGLLNQCDYVHADTETEALGLLNNRFKDHKLRCIRRDDVVLEEIRY